MKIISGSSRLRFNSRLNHAGFAHLHNYRYVFDSTPRPLESVYDHKLLAILDLPVDGDRWFWIDDDAFFTQFSRPLEAIGLDFDAALLIFPKSPEGAHASGTHVGIGCPYESFPASPLHNAAVAARLRHPPVPSDNRSIPRWRGAAFSGPEAPTRGSPARRRAPR